MIRSFRHKGLRDLFQTGSSAKVRPDLQARVLRRLDVLDKALSLAALNAPGFGFHAMRGAPGRYAFAVNGPWRITFEWRDGDAWAIDLEQYH